MPVNITGAVGDDHRAARHRWDGDLWGERLEPGAVMRRDQVRHRTERDTTRREALIVGITCQQSRVAAGEADMERKAGIVLAATGSGTIHEAAAGKGHDRARLPDQEIAFRSEDRRKPSRSRPDPLTRNNPSAIPQMWKSECCMEMIPVPMRQNDQWSFGRIRCKIPRRRVSVEGDRKADIEVNQRFSLNVH
ncbi:hypothetical protein mvi_51760 [Methylobacterium indicum]|uniref:Uncharacterized protein n=1 Tax=Methylobacterium indicum TaxID=1775910 RepID=A0A8H8WYH1_9HYPH|nr:hypothetical protein mvi_51760 [Methylobacterium indicum]